MKTFKSLLFCIFLINAAFAQIKMPQFDRVEIDKKHYFQTYTPKGFFAEQFPNFMNDGKYHYDSIFPDYLPKDPEFSAKDYPADVASATNSFKGIKKIYIRNCPFIAEWKDTTNIEEVFKKQLMERGVGKVTTENIKDLLTANPKLPDADNDFIIDIGLIYGTVSRNTTNMMYSDNVRDLSRYDRKRFKTGELFPKFRIYKMTIRNRLGEVVKTYGQAIFVDAYINDLGNKKFNKACVEIYNRSAITAANSLISRFLNDDEFVNRIYADSKSISEKFAINKDYNTIANIALRFGRLDYWRGILSKNCEDLKVNLSDFSKYVDSHKNNQPTFIPSALNSAQTNQVASSVNALATSIVSGIFDRQIENIHKETLATLKNEIAKYDREMQEVIDDVAVLPPSTDKNELITRIQRSNPDLSGSLQEVLDADKKSNGSMAAAKTERNALLDNMNYTLQSLRPGSGQVSSAAITSTSSVAPVDECSTKATAEWKSSTEYKTYMHTKLNADMKDCEAKLVELTLQYCGSKLSVTERAGDEKAAREARQAAKDIRSGGAKIKL